MKTIYLNYKITNLINGKVYIGYHTGNETDGYLCSAGVGDITNFWSDIRKFEPGCKDLSVGEIKEFYAKNGFINFKKETIQYYSDKKSMKDGEIYWIAFYRNLLGWENVYNIIGGGDDGWDGYYEYAKLHPEILSERSRKAAATQLANGTHPFQNLTDEQLSERAKKREKNMTPEQKSARSMKAMETMGPEGLSNRAKKISENLGPEGRSERSKNTWRNKTPEERSEIIRKRNENITPEKKLEIKAKLSSLAKARMKDGTHHLLHLTPEQLSERNKKISKTIKAQWKDKTPEQITELNGKANESRAINYVFYNPSTDTYKVHVANWNSRFKHGFTERLCKLSDWEDYKILHNLDVTL